MIEPADLTDKQKAVLRALYRIRSFALSVSEYADPEVWALIENFYASAEVVSVGTVQSIVILLPTEKADRLFEDGTLE